MGRSQPSSLYVAVACCSGAALVADGLCATVFTWLVPSPPHCMLLSPVAAAPPWWRTGCAPWCSLGSFPALRTVCSCRPLQRRRPGGGRRVSSASCGIICINRLI
ncbi:hypothetical protein GDO78_010215 [Eleutherodactylus coqui]|uniref:Uncharacterized protein n=1 Tax=Eleutherodactylus coqui TaxID=57060 RepID=A0A8J6K6U4_ELECQ|nr:hypothetical protein GDO78_010215 [Eleutherodactylus coqui]